MIKVINALFTLILSKCFVYIIPENTVQTQGPATVYAGIENKQNKPDKHTVSTLQPQ